MFYNIGPRLQRIATDKHKIIWPNVSDEEKRFYNIDTRSLFITWKDVECWNDS